MSHRMGAVDRISSCNYCLWEEMRQRHKDFQLQPDPHPGFPKGKRVIDRDGQPTGTWFAEVPDRCAC